MRNIVYLLYQTSARPAGQHKQVHQTVPSVGLLKCRFSKGFEGFRGDPGTPRTLNTEQGSENVEGVYKSNLLRTFNFLVPCSFFKIGDRELSSPLNQTSSRPANANKSKIHGPRMTRMTRKYVCFSGPITMTLLSTIITA